MHTSDGGPILISPNENVIFAVNRKKDTPCKASWTMTGWGSCGPDQQPDEHTRVRKCEAPPTVSAKCNSTVAVDFGKDEQGTFDPEEVYSVTISGETGPPITVPFSPPPVINGQTFHFQVSKP